LLAKNPVLLAKVIDDLQLMLVHPSCDGDQDELEGIQDSRHLVDSLSPQQRNLFVRQVDLADSMRTERFPVIGCKDHDRVLG
jgi:hypothetical protein